MTRPHLLSLAIAQCLALGTAHAATITVLSAADVVADDGACTLREAIENANNDSQNGRTSAGECAAGDGADEIDIGIGAGGPPQTITLLLGEILISSPMQILGPGRDQLTIDADGLSRHFHIVDDDFSQHMSVSLSDLRLFNGRTNALSAFIVDGGSILNRESLNLSRLTIEGSTAREGGGIHLFWSPISSQLVLDDVRLLNNQARQGAGASLGADGGLIEIRNSVISGNRAVDAVNATGTGLKFNVDNSVVRISDSTISNNTQTACEPCSGAGLAVSASSGSSLTLERLLVSGNAASGVGQNRALGVGMSLQLAESTLVLRDSTISNNQHIGNRVKGGGAFIYVADAPTALIERVTVSDNTAGGTGAGMYLYSYGNTELRLLDSTISGNTAGQGGGGLEVYAYDGSGVSTLSVIGSSIVNNLSQGNSGLESGGGGILIDVDSTGTIVLAGSVIANNQDLSTTPAHDIELSGLSATLTDSLIGDNSGSGLIEAPLGMPDGNNNLIGGAVGGVIDPLLAPLTDNGGLTFTHRPGSDSPLVDHYNGCTGTDQTGAPRGLDLDGSPGNDCDIGAVELAQSLFADGFEQTVLRRGYDARGLALKREELLQSLPADGRVRVVAIVLNADGSSKVLIHGRRQGEQIEVQQHQLEQGRWRQGDWQPLNEHSAWLNW